MTSRYRRSTVHPPTKAREYTIPSTMSARLAAVPLAILILAPAAVQRPGAQSSVPASAPGKKTPLLKLAEPWPDVAALKARRAEAEARPLFSGTEPFDFTLTANFG